jgi:DNA-binding FadR family transcriptional regulator
MFKAIPTNRISKVVADQIRDAVFQKRLKPGDRLPPERKLMEEFEVSRVTIREALRSLEHFGIIEIKRGFEGGAFIKDPSTKFVNNYLQDIFSLGKIKVCHLTEARFSVEPSSVKLACERMTEGFLKQIELNIKETKECLDKGNKNDARLLNLEFHRKIAQASENPVIFFMIDSIMDIMENNISSIPLLGKPVARSLKFHEEIYFAIRDRNAKGAHDLMQDHIMNIQKALDTTAKELLKEKRSYYRRDKNENSCHSF